MELFRPSIKGDVFSIDLDTVVVKDISHMVRNSIDTVLGDFYYPLRMASGLMYVTEETRRVVWETWIKDPSGYMLDYEKGDQKFLATTGLNSAKRWQERYPNQVISFKRHMRPSPPLPKGPQLATPPDGARIVCFHGTPRPREIYYEDWIREAWS